MFFDSFSGVGRTLVVGSLASVALIVILRVSGKHTLSKMNAFDLVVAVALGSTLATTLLSKSVALAEGLTALALLAGLQYAVAWLTLRSDRFGQLVKSEPGLLLDRGRLLRDRMRAERVVEAEVLQAARNQGGSSLEDVEAVVLESDGSFAVIQKGHGGGGVLRNVQGAPNR